MSSTRAPKDRKVRKHPTGISAPCRNGKHSQCSMLDCQDDCHESEALAELPLSTWEENRRLENVLYGS